MIDWSISVGNLLTIASFLFGGTVFAMKVVAKLERLGERVVDLEKTIEKFGGVLEMVARQDERLKHQEGLLEDMRHGRGFVFAPSDWNTPVPPNMKRGG